MKHKVRAFLIYGLIGGPFPYGIGYSLGFDGVARRMREEGIDASTHVEGVLLPHTNVRRLAARASEAAASGQRVALIGHSLGADAAVKVAARLARRRLSVDLLIGFDPTRFACPRVPANVRRAVCFYQREFADFLGRGRFRPGREFTGECVNERVPYRHKKMADAHELQERVLDETRKLLA